MQRICAYLAAVCLTAATAAARAEEPPVTFARAGRQAVVPIGAEAARPGAKLVLRAFGQAWGEPAGVKNGAAEFTAPRIRVPVVFQVIALDNVDAVLAELVVYPDRPAGLEGDVTWIAAGAPDWFYAWCDALALPLARHRDLRSFRAADRPVPGRQALLVAGCVAPGDDPAALARLAVERNVNLLVLAGSDTCSKGANGRTMTVLPKHTCSVLADLQAQQWALPPIFAGCRSPFSRDTLRIANRQTWLAGPGWPLVEELRTPVEGAESRRLVVSYLPWHRQLGRSEVADSLFRRLLAEAAREAAGRRRLAARWRLLHPAAGDVAPSQRPVLAAALGSLAPAEDSQGGMDIPVRHPEKGTTPESTTDGNVHPTAVPLGAYVLDVRGDVPLPADFFDRRAVKDVETRRGPTPLLILGDNSALDRWKWLAVDRTGAGKDGPAPPRCRPGVVWLRDDALPPSAATQLRMMQLFTDWNIALETM